MLGNPSNCTLFTHVYPVTWTSFGTFFCRAQIRCFDESTFDGHGQDYPCSCRVPETLNKSILTAKVALQPKNLKRKGGEYVKYLDFQ